MNQQKKWQSLTGIVVTTDNRKIKAVTDWIGDGIFNFSGSTYSIEDFLPETYPTMFYDEAGKLHYTSGYLKTDPILLIEYEDGMEWFRLWRELPND